MLGFAGAVRACSGGARGDWDRSDGRDGPQEDRKRFQVMRNGKRTAAAVDADRDKAWRRSVMQNLPAFGNLPALSQ
jgi:hypothetical protein